MGGRKNIFSGIFESLKSIAKGVVNGLISILTMILLYTYGSINSIGRIDKYTSVNRKDMV